MELRRLVLAAAALAAAAACGSNSNAGSGSGNGTGGNGAGTGTTCVCQPGFVCSASGTCVPASGSGSSGGVAACTTGDVLPAPQPSTFAASATLGAASVVVYDAVHQVGSTATFTLPAGAASLTVVEQAATSTVPNSVTYVAAGQTFTTDNVAVPQTVTGPGFAYDDLVDGFGESAWSDYTGHQAFFVSDSPGTGTWTIPNTSAGLALAGTGGLPAGTWSVRVSDFAYECATLRGVTSCPAGGSTSSTYHLTVIAKPVAVATANLDVAVYFATASVDGLPLTAATAESDPNLTRMKSTLAQVFHNAGITLRSVTFHDLPAAALGRFAAGVGIDETGVCSDLPQLLTYAQPGNTFNLFLVSGYIEKSNGQQIQTVGVDGTIPGPPGFGGTVASGATVWAADLRTGTCPASGVDYFNCGADELAYIAAHEAGHFMGLYHVTEEYGFQFDPLSDTPTCACSACSSQPSTCSDPLQGTPPDTADTMRVSECLGTKPGCAGGDNLMFWLLARQSAGTVTDEQGRVMRANPVVQ